MIEKQFAKLPFYLENNVRTVILEGERGVGKTEVIQDLFDKKFGKGGWRYYSGSTMDPFIDMLGCPIKTKDEETGKYFLDMIQPKDFALDKVQAIFLDEWNRSKEQVRNACLELIQFGRMNGKEFKNLKFIWAAVNPDDGNYQVDEMDPAQKDRFIVYLKLPYEISETYFYNKYPDLAAPVIEWWKSLPKDIQKLVSPRRLDYALKFYEAGGDLGDVLDDKSNISKLVNALKSGSYLTRYKRLKKNYEEDNTKGGAITTFFEDPNNYYNVHKFVIKNDPKFIKFFSEENISNLISEEDVVFQHVMNNLNDKKYSTIIDNITESSLNPATSEKIKNHPKWMEYNFMKDEPEDPRCAELEKQLANISGRENVYKFVEQNKKALVGSEIAVQKLVDVNEDSYDVNNDPLIVFLMMDGLQ